MTMLMTTGSRMTTLRLRADGNGDEDQDEDEDRGDDDDDDDEKSIFVIKDWSWPEALRGHVRAFAELRSLAVRRGCSRRGSRFLRFQWPAHSHSGTYHLIDKCVENMSDKSSWTIKSFPLVHVAFGDVHPTFFFVGYSFVFYSIIFQDQEIWEWGCPPTEANNWGFFNPVYCRVENHVTFTQSNGWHGGGFTSTTHLTTDFSCKMDIVT